MAKKKAAKKKHHTEHGFSPAMRAAQRRILAQRPALPDDPKARELRDGVRAYKRMVRDQQKIQQLARQIRRQMDRSDRALRELADYLRDRDGEYEYRTLRQAPPPNAEREPAGVVE